MNLKRGFRPVTEVLAVIVGFVCGLLIFCVFISEVGWYWVPGVLVALPGVCIGYWIVWFVYWFSEWLTHVTREGVGSGAEQKSALNRKQQVCLWLGIVVFVLLAIFPPWLCRGKGWPQSVSQAFILSRRGLEYMIWCDVYIRRLCFRWAIVAVITVGLILTFRYKKPTAQKDNYSQKRKAKIYILTILMAAAILLLAASILRPLLKTPRRTASRVVFGTNMSGIAKALMVYVRSVDDAGRLPPPDKWCDLLVQYDVCTPRHFVRIESDAILGESNVAINKNIAGKSIRGIPGDVVLLFETDFGKDPRGRQDLLQNRGWYKDPGREDLRKWYRGSQKVYKLRWNQAGGPEILTTKHHFDSEYYGGEYCNVAFVDGSVKGIKPKEVGKLKWKAD